MYKPLLLLFAFFLTINAGWGQTEAALARATNYITGQQGIFEDIQLSSSDIYVSSSHISSISGVSHIYFQQTLHGIDILNKVGSVHLDRTQEVGHATNRFINVSDYSQQSGRSLDAVTAIGHAADHYRLPRVGQTRLLSQEGGPGEKQTYIDEALSLSSITAKLVYIPKGQNLVLAWEVFLDKPNDGMMVLAYINAQSGAVDLTKSLANTCEHNGAIDCKGGVGHTHITSTSRRNEPKAVPSFAAETYTVFAIPLEAPNEGSVSEVTAPWNKALNASPFGWHDTNGIAGPESTLTRGNNVVAVDDLDANNFGGSSPDGGPTLMFNAAIDTSMQPDTYLDGAITNLFYMNNIMHDVTYQFGFDEGAGNFQFNNYGNGGAALGSDEVNADAQDGSGVNNANFSTPSDGFNPRMQMFRWVEDLAFVDVLAPGSVAGSYDASGASFNPINSSVTGNVVLAQPIDGCGALTNGQMINGNVALIDRGSCNFTVKVDNAIAAGAIGVIICNNAPGGTTLTMGGSTVTRSRASAMLSFEDCQTIRVHAGSGLNVNLRTERTVPDTDSDLDNGIIAHEYGHGISNRLTGGRTNVGCLGGNEQMGEGWSDYYGLMLQLKPGDMAGDRNGIGTYVTFDTPDGDGIRPFPYSTDFNINPFTYNDIGSGVSIPHGVGSVWCTMLWDMTWNLIEKHGFEPDLYSTSGGNGISMQLVMEGMKLQPCTPGFVDGRDGILAADTLLFGGANSCEIWRAFARRGLGVGASQGQVQSVTDGVESFVRPDGCFDELILPCTEESIVYNGVSIPDGTNERANSTITIDDSEVLAGDMVSLRAAQSITFVDTMQVASTATLFLKTIPCDDSGLGAARPSDDQKKALAPWLKSTEKSD